MARERRKRSLPVRLVRVAATTCVALFALYVVVANVLLSTPLLEKLINADPETVDVHFEHAWSIVPQYVHAEKISVRGRDSSIEWMLRIDEAEFRLSLVDLVKQRFSASHVRAKGVSFRLRQRLDAEPTSPEQVADLPPIEGLPAYAVRPPKKPDLTDADYNLWTLHLESTLAEDVREVWVDNVRFAGSARVEGRFYFKPVRAVEVGPLRLAVARGELSLGKNRVAEAVQGSFDLTAERFDPRTADVETLRGVSLVTDARATIPDVASLPLPPPHGETVHGRIEMSRIALHVTSGKLEKESQVALAMPNAVATADNVRATGALVLDADVEDPEQVAFHASLTDVLASREEGARCVTLLSAPKITANGATTTKNLTHALADLHFVVDATATIPDIAALPLPLPPDASIQGEVLVSRASLHVASGRLRQDSHVALAMPSAAVITRAHRVTGALALAADVDEPDRLTFHASMTRLEASHEGVAVLRAPEVTAVGDSRELGLTHPLSDMHFVVEVPEGSVPDTRALSRYIPSTTPVEIEGGEGKAQLRVEAWLAEKRATGRAVLRAEDLDFRLAKMRVRGRASVQAQFGSYDFGTQRLEDARLTIDVPVGVLASNAAPETPLVRLSGTRLAASAPSVDLADPLRALRVAISLPSGDVVTRGLLREYLPGGSEMEAGTTHARFSLSCNVAIVDHVAAGTLDIQSRDLTFDYRDLRLDAELRASARLHDWHWERGDAALDHAGVEVRNVTISRGSATPGLSVALIGVGAKSQHFDFGDPRGEVDLSALFVDAKIRDFSAANAFLPEKATYGFEGKDATFGAGAEVAFRHQVASGTIWARASNMGVTEGGVHLQGDIDAFAAFADLKNDKMRLLDSHVELSRVTGRFAPDGPPQLSGERLFVRSSSPSFDLAHPTLKGAELHLVVDHLELPDLRALAPLVPESSVLGIESGSARVDADVDMSHERRSATGHLDILVAHGGVRVRKVHMTGDFRVSARLAGFDPEHEALDVSGSRVEMRDVAVTDASAATSAWRGDIVFRHASFALSPRMLFDGDVDIDARDARPVLALAFGNDLPKLVVRLSDMPHLVASTRVIVGSRELALLDLDARGGDVALRGSYAMDLDHRRGAVVVKKSFVSVGIRVDDKGTYVRFFGLNKWLRGRNCRVKELVETGGEVCL